MKDINLIRKIAWSFEATTNVDFDELFCEAALGYLEAIKKYDPTKGKLSVFLWHRMDYKLRLYLLREERDLPADIEDRGEPIPYRIPFEELLKVLPAEVLPIVDIITENQDEFEIMSVSSSKKEIKKALREQGWSWPMIYRNIKKLKLALN